MTKLQKAVQDVVRLSRMVDDFLELRIAGDTLEKEWSDIEAQLCQCGVYSDKVKD